MERFVEGTDRGQGRAHCFLNAWKSGFARIIRFALLMSLSINSIFWSSDLVGSILRRPDGLHTIHRSC